MVDVNQKIVDGLEKLGLPWPGGNSVTLQTIAGDWDTLANALSASVQYLDGAVDGLTPQQWSGDAHDAFVSQWKNQAAQVQAAVTNFHKVADGLRQYADQIESINEEIVSIVEQILAATAIGAVLTVLTAGISDAVSAAADAAELARIVALIARFTEWAERIGQTLKETLGVTEDVAKVLEKLAETLGKMTKTFATNFIADSGSSMISQGLSGQTVTAGADIRNGALDAAGTTFTDGLLSNVPGVKTVLSGDASPILNGTIGNMGGAMFEDGVNDAESPGSVSTTQWVEDLVTSGATGFAGSAIGRGIANRGKTDESGTGDGDGDGGSADADGGTSAGEDASAADDAGSEGGIELQNLTPIRGSESDGESGGGGREGSGGDDNGGDDAGGGSDTSSDTASFYTADSSVASFHTANDDPTGFEGSEGIEGTEGTEGAESTANTGDSAGAGDSGDAADAASTHSSDSAASTPSEPGGYGPGKVTAMSTAANLGVYTVGSVIEGGIQNITGQAQSASQILSSLENLAKVDEPGQNQA
jgi:WXG100 family type VII secretion target